MEMVWKANFQGYQVTLKNCVNIYKHVQWQKISLTLFIFQSAYQRIFLPMPFQVKEATQSPAASFVKTETINRTVRT